MGRCPKSSPPGRRPWPVRGGPAGARGPPPRPASSPPGRRAPRGRRRPGPRWPARPVPPGDRDPHGGQYLGHDLHVGDPGDVDQHVTTLGQQAGGHELQHRVLGAPARTVPERGPLELTTNRSTGPVCPLRGCPRGPRCVARRGAQMTGCSAQRPKTPARDPTISPTVAWARTASKMAGSRFRSATPASVARRARPASTAAGTGAGGPRPAACAGPPRPRGRSGGWAAGCPRSLR